MKVHYLCLQATREGQASYSHVHEIIAGLGRRGAEVRLFEPHYSQDAPSALVRLLAFITVQLRMMACARPDVVYVRWHFATLPAALWFRLRGVPVVQEVNGHYEDLFSVWPWTRRFAVVFTALSRWQLRLADAVIVVTEQLVDWSRRQGVRARVSVIPNGANTRLFAPGAATTLALPESFVVFFGALSPWQGVGTLLAAKALPEWPPEVALVLAGDGVDRVKVEQAAARDAGIVYLGRLPQRELPGVVGRSLAGLIPKSNAAGHEETGLMPLKLFEMMACGVPVIVTDFPGMADVVREAGCGLVVAPDDAAQLAAAVRDCAAHPAEAAAMGRRGQQEAEAGHSWDARASQTYDLLLGVAQARP